MEGGCVSDWVEVSLPPNGTCALLMVGMLRKTGAPTDERQGAGFCAPHPLSAIPGHVLVPKPALAEARRLPEDTTGSDSW
jgi:hypothetical protein